MRISDWSSYVCSSDLLVADQRHRQTFEIELQAARQHRHQQLLRIGGRKNELDVRRRLLKRLQQRVERALRQHVDFIDQIDLVATAGRCVLRDRKSTRLNSSPYSATRMPSSA